ncbi:MAG: DUF4271 domain-containing protein [Bacteroidaceae bacterium]|nr:DUF4271 domain-containing protein [Bacteroidaceae bacterium]
MLLSSINTPVSINDWFLLVMIVSMVLMVLIMGPYWKSYKTSIRSMYKFNTPDGDVEYPLFSTLGFVTVFVLSCIGIAIALVIYSQDVSVEGTEPLLTLLSVSLVIVLCFVAKLLLYTIVNNWLYKSQTINLKPLRWNCFVVMSFSVGGFVILLLAFIVHFFSLPLFLLLILSYLVRILIISGIIFKIKTSLFKNRSSNSGFILYLCAFEIVPVIIELGFLNEYIGLI